MKFWAVKVPKTEPGGWYFEFNNEFYPDTDDTAQVLMALNKVDNPRERYQHQVAERFGPGADDEPFAVAAGLSLARYTCEVAPANTLGWLVLGGSELAGVAALNPRVSDTGEIVHDWQAGQVKIDTPRTQAVTGPLALHMPRIVARPPPRCRCNTCPASRP